jgi:hypothetical protein
MAIIHSVDYSTRAANFIITYLLGNIHNTYYLHAEKMPNLKGNFPLRSKTFSECSLVNFNF